MTNINNTFHLMFCLKIATQQHILKSTTYFSDSSFKYPPFFFHAHTHTHTQIKLIITKYFILLHKFHFQNLQREKTLRILQQSYITKMKVSINYKKSLQIPISGNQNPLVEEGQTKQWPQKQSYFQNIGRNNQKMFQRSDQVVLLPSL